ncbi:hypothetical protein [Streptomyces fungicidicus]
MSDPTPVFDDLRKESAELDREGADKSSGLVMRRVDTRWGIRRVGPADGLPDV